MVRKRKKKKTKARLFITIVLIVIILVACGILSGFTWGMYSENKKWDVLVYPGIKVADVDLGGKTKTEATKLLKDKYGDTILMKKINISADKKVYTIDYSKLGARYDIDNMVEKAFIFGKGLSMTKKSRLIRDKEGTSEQYKLTFTYEDKYVNEVIGNIEKVINKEPVNASILMISSGKFKVTPDVKGYKLERDKLEKSIKDKINGDLSGDINIQAPIQEFTAVITGDKLSTIDTKISSYSTDFATSSYERANNINTSTKSINGKLLMPGDTFSFNDVVGERTKESGYKEAPVIVGNKIESGIGGGICQVSSTLYNALLKTEVKTVERVHHTLPSSYVGLGFDATVDWGTIDYRFKNTLEYPIFIEGYTENKNLHFNIYSNSSLTKRSYTLVNDVYETIQSTTKTIDDPTLPIGEMVIEQKAYNGFKVKVMRNIYENGVLINSAVMHNDYYMPVTGIIKKGTKK